MLCFYCNKYYTIKVIFLLVRNNGLISFCTHSELICTAHTKAKHKWDIKREESDLLSGEA